MFNKSQLFAAAILAVSASSVLASPIYTDLTDIEARSHSRDVLTELKRRAIVEYLQDLEARASTGPPYGNNGKGSGWITPTKGKGKDGKVRQTSEVLAVQKHKEKEPGHTAVKSGNTAHVQSSFHQNGGPNHATVKYKNAKGAHVTTLHIAKDGTRLSGNQQPPAHAKGKAAPPNSPVTPKSPRPARPVPRKAKTMRRSIIDFLEDIEARGSNGPPFGNNGKGAGWITPTKDKGKDGKVRQTSEVLAVQKHKEKEPGHTAVKSGNTAHVQSSFHQNGGPNHATVKYKSAKGDHVTTLHLAKDGTRLVGGQQPPAHAKGKAAPPNSPVSPSGSRPGSPSGSKKRELEFEEFIARELGLFDELD